MAHAAVVDRDRRLRIRLPSRTRPLDDLPQAMATLHVAGFFRAAISALDCLGAVIVGVVGLPARILRSDIGITLRALDRCREPSTPGGRLQMDFGARFRQLIHDAGPDGWLEWTTTFRNMLAHRARRIEFIQLRSDSSLYGPYDEPIIRTESIHHLTRDPGLSDIEALLYRRRQELVLSERAEASLDGVLASTIRLAETTARNLLNVWNARRQAPDLVRQPREQWPDGAAQPDVAFQGYAPGSVEVNPGGFVSGPDTPRRLLASALTDDLREQWRIFD